MEKLFEVASNISIPLGVAGILVVVTYFIFRQIIKKTIFPTLTRILSAEILRLIIKCLYVLTLVAIVLGFAGFTLSLIYKPSPMQSQEVITFSGRVIDAKTARIIQGAKISVRFDDKVLTDESDSKGVFAVKLRPEVKFVYLKVEAENFGPYADHAVPSNIFTEVSLNRIATARNSQNSNNVNEDSNDAQQPSNIVGIDRNLSGVEISYRPSTEHWSKILSAYQQTRSPMPSVPYNSVSMTAERVRGYWVITFRPIPVDKGFVLFPQVSTDQPNNKAFEDVIREAMIGLTIRWANNIEVNLDPLRNDYPSTISVSKENIAFTLTPPQLTLNVSNLKTEPIVTFRGRDYPSDVRILSLDPGLLLDQTLHLNWKRVDGVTAAEQIKPYVSGPHQLDVTLTTASAALPSNDDSSNSCQCTECGGKVYCPNPGFCMSTPCGVVCCSSP